MGRAYRDFLKQLTPIIESGAPIRHGLTMIRGHRSVVSIAESVLIWLESGESFADSLSRVQPPMSPVHVAMIRAGEEGGHLVDACQAVVAELDDHAEWGKDVLARAAYPLLVVCIALVVPPLALYFFAGKTLENTWFHLGLALVFGCFCLLLFGGVRIFPQGSASRRRAERFFLALPFLRVMILDRFLSRSLRLFSRLLSAGVSIDRSLELIEDSFTWDELRSEFSSMRIAVSQGKSVGAAFDANALIPPEVIGRISSGEESGKLDSALASVADELESRFKHRLGISLRVAPIVLYLFAAYIVLSLALEVMGRPLMELP